ncbi:MAG: Tol-Pal system beta propeller repeat protein TolB [Deltaproteobacteria bacterium]|nr:Tol-Pal system beta propeller repeat protein TolB [Deltaproteobacteria bacterium]
MLIDLFLLMRTTRLARFIRLSSPRRRALAAATALLAFVLLVPATAPAKIYIDINAPSIRKFKVALPDFKNLGESGARPELARALPAVVSNDLYLSGYFSPIDKGAFLEAPDGPLNLEDIRFRDWTVIGAELLVKGSYTVIGQQLEVEMRVYDTFWGRQILGKRVLGDVRGYRKVMHRLSNEVVLLLTGHDGIFFTKVAFVGNASGNKEIYVCDFDGYNLRQITSDRSIALLPRWSPDGRKIAFNSFKDGEGAKLYIKDLASGGVRRVSGRSGLNTGAAWAPDGGQLALTLSKKGNPDIYTIDKKGKILRKLTNHWGIDVSPTFSSDGKKIAYVSDRSGTPQVYILDLENGNERRLTFEGNYNTSPTWSSFNRIAYASMNGGKFDIYTIDAEGGDVRQLTEGRGNNEDPCWSPGGRYIIFSSDRGGRYNLYLMNGNGQNQNKISNLKGGQSSPSWTK